MKNIAQELRQLQDMHSNGDLTDEEFAQAKALLLDGTTSTPKGADQGADFTVDPDRDMNPGLLRVNQIVAAVLILGIVIFLGIVLFLVQAQNGGQGKVPPLGNLPMISIMVVLFFIIQAPLSFLLPALMVRGQLRRIAADARGPWSSNPSLYATAGGKLMALFQTSMLIGLALLEGTALFGCIAYWMEAQLFTLGIVCLCLVLMLLRFPTAGRVRAWLERQGEALNALRA